MNADPARRHLVVFARRPRLGQGKRRLAREVGELEALRFQRFALQRLVRALRDETRWTLWLCLTPGRGLDFSRAPRVLPQGGGDLGARLTRLVRRLPSGQVVVIGADAPQIRRSDIANAFRALGHSETVLGPAPDGGFWLVGLARRARRRPPFQNVRWSTRHAREDVLRELGESSAALLRELEDVDDAASLRRVAQSLWAMGLAGA